jgi:hypothetical protein
MSSFSIKETHILEKEYILKGRTICFINEPQMMVIAYSNNLSEGAHLNFFGYEFFKGLKFDLNNSFSMAIKQIPTCMMFMESLSYLIIGCTDNSLLFYKLEFSQGILVNCLVQNSYKNSIANQMMTLMNIKESNKISTVLITANNNLLHKFKFNQIGKETRSYKETKKMKFHISSIDVCCSKYLAIGTYIGDFIILSPQKFKIISKFLASPMKQSINRVLFIESEMIFFVGYEKGILDIFVPKNSKSDFEHFKSFMPFKNKAAIIFLAQIFPFNQVVKVIFRFWLGIIKDRFVRFLLIIFNKLLL